MRSRIFCIRLIPPRTKSFSSVFCKKGKIHKCTAKKCKFTESSGQKGSTLFDVSKSSSKVKKSVALKSLNPKHNVAIKAVNVKKSAKQLILTATVIYGLDGKKVTFKFNDKTYTAKTVKGIAKVTIPKSALKKLKVGKTVKYQAKFLKETASLEVQVKK